MMIVKKTQKMNKSIAFRVNASVVDEFRALAKEIGINQALTIENILIDLVREMKEKKNEKK